MITLKEKVTAKLIKGGNNPLEVTKMVELHFASASSLYTTVKCIAEYIRTVY